KDHRLPCSTAMTPRPGRPCPYVTSPRAPLLERVPSPALRSPQSVRRDERHPPSAIRSGLLRQTTIDSNPEIPREQSLAWPLQTASLQSVRTTVAGTGTP